MKSMSIRAIVALLTLALAFGCLTPKPQNQRTPEKKRQAPNAALYEAADNARSWLYRATNAKEALDRCVANADKRHATTEFTVLMRIADGSIVAAEAVGIGTEESSLKCAVDSVIGIPVDGSRDFNFIEEHASNAEPFEE